MQRAITVLALFLVALVAANARAADPVTPNELKQIGLAYHNYFSIFNKGPAKAEDLSKFLDDNKKLIDVLKDGDVVFIFNVGILDMKDGTSKTVIAYPKDIAKDGGPVLYGDGSVKKLTADEFKKAIIAKPKN